MSGWKTTGETNRRPLRPPLSYSRDTAKIRGSLLLENEDCRRDRRGPQRLLIADRRLRDVHGAHDLVRHPVDFLLLVPALIRIEFDVQGGREHFGREFFGVVAGHL